jgi:hypothetical protein
VNGEDDSLNRAELQALAEERRLDAIALLEANRWTGAYYLTGYVVEIGLKSCVLAHLEKTGMLFKNRKYLKDLGECWTHELAFLAKLAGLDEDLGLACQANSALAGFWGVVKDWKETTRYEHKTQNDATGLFEAIDHDPNGVLRWIRKYW